MFKAQVLKSAAECVFFRYQQEVVFKLKGIKDTGVDANRNCRRAFLDAAYRKGRAGGPITAVYFNSPGLRSRLMSTAWFFTPSMRPWSVNCSISAPRCTSLCPKREYHSGYLASLVPSTYFL